MKREGVEDAWRARDGTRDLQEAVYVVLLMPRLSLTRQLGSKGEARKEEGGKSKTLLSARDDLVASASALVAGHAARGENEA